MGSSPVTPLLNASAIQRAAGAVWKVEVVPEIDSTNLELLRRAGLQGFAKIDHCALIAEHQLAGRGRRENVWESPPAENLLMSIALLLPSASPASPLLSQVAGLAAIDSIKELFPEISPQMKWPNDLLADGKKFGGILVEARADSVTGQSFAIIGLGLNVTSSPSLSAPHALAATSLWDLLDSDAPPDRNSLAAKLLNNFENLLSGVSSDHWLPVIHRELNRNSALIGKNIVAELPDQKIISGLAKEIEFDGCLRVLSNDGKVHSLRSVNQIRLLIETNDEADYHP